MRLRTGMRIPVNLDSDSGLKPITDSGQSDHVSERGGCQIMSLGARIGPMIFAFSVVILP